jgi:hypothetical protein
VYTNTKFSIKFSTKLLLVNFSNRLVFCESRRSKFSTRVYTAAGGDVILIIKLNRIKPLFVYGGYTLRSVIEAPLITREVLHETHFLLVIMAADAQARPFLQFQASC